MQVNKGQYSQLSQYKVGSRVLSIQNVTAEDEGQYICKVTLISRKTNNNSTFTLKVLSKFKKQYSFNISINYNLI